MNCLICGHKLAIFRKLSLGDFCCQEHRALFVKDQSDRGLARLMDSGGDPKTRAVGTRVFAQFFLDEVQASEAGPGFLSCDLISPERIVGPSPRRMPLPGLAPPQYAEFAKFVLPQPGLGNPVGFEVAGLSLRLPGKRQPTWNGNATHLRPAGLILPWSTGARAQTVFSLAPLAAAAWAQSGFCKPISAHCLPIGALPVSWPSIEGKLEVPVAAVGFAPAAISAVAPSASQPMQVRLATPLVARHRPMLELPVPARIEECPPEPIVSAPAARATIPAAPRKKSLFKTIFATNPRPVLTGRPRTRALDRDEHLGFDSAGLPMRPSSGDAWRAMLSGWTPSAAGVSGLFAVLFLFSALAIFLSAPSAMSYRAPSFKWGNLRNAIRNRAVLKVEDDFRAGLNGWSFPTGWAQDWSYDQAGFLRPGKLGFLDKSMKLVNYRLELMGQIERKSMGWAFRARDSKNYYVAKLTIAQPGPLPLVDLIHYPVLNGKEGAKVRVTLPFAVRNDTLYQVEMNVRGDAFRATVNGHVVDSWTDNSLRAGGVGFVSGQGEAARVRWIRVSDRDDVIGRVCSYLSARADQPSDDPVLLSASQYMLFRRPGQ
jgi:hypothetical protein